MSKLSPVFFGTITDKQTVKLEDKESYELWKDHFKPGTEIELTLRKRQKKRSKWQNNYYWKICQLIADETGYDTAQEVHEAIKMLYLLEKKEGIPDTARSTTDLTTVEFSDLISKIKRDAALGRFGGGENGIYIPEAGKFQ